MQGIGKNTTNGQIIESGGPLGAIKGGTTRFALAEGALTNLGNEGYNLIKTGLTELLRAGLGGPGSEIESIRESFSGAANELNQVAGEAGEILRHARASSPEGKPSLSRGDAQKLEALNERATRLIGTITELVKQLYFHNKKDDEGPHGGAGAAPMLMITVGAD